MLLKLIFCSVLAIVVSSEKLDFNAHDQLMLNDIVIRNNTVGGNINVNTADDWYQQSEEDTETFDDGCVVSGSMLQECDGTQRMLTRTEKSKMKALIARKKMARRSRKSRPSRTVHHKSRRDVEGEEECESPCKTCSTGASFAKKAARKH